MVTPRNKEYSFAVEYTIPQFKNNLGKSHWSQRGKYKTQRAMLQGLKTMRNQRATYEGQAETRDWDGNLISITRDHWEFRPVHLYQ